MKNSDSQFDKRLQLYKNYIKENNLIYQVIQQMEIVKNDTLSLVSSYVLAPALGGFVIWLLKSAMENNIKRLYFLARDGYFMYHASLILCNTLHLPIECRYLSCSRYSLRIPMFHLDHNTALDYICRGGIDVTLTKILSRAGLTKNESEKIIKHLGLSSIKNNIIPYQKLSEIRKQLSQCEIFFEYMDTHSKQAFPNLAGYLKQEGLLENISYAIVDSGWVGSMQKTLYDILKYMGYTNKLQGYYWGLYELAPNTNKEHYHCYYFDPNNHIKEKVYFNNCLFEAIYTAPHGMTLYYQKDREKYIPYYGIIDQDRKKFINKIEIYLMKYISILAKELKLIDLYNYNLQNDKNIIKKLLKAFMAFPSKEEAEIFGSLPFSDDVLEGNDNQIAAYLSEQEFKSNHVINKALNMSGIRNNYIKESAWYEGSVVRYAKHIKRHLMQYTIYKYLRYIKKSYIYKKQSGEKI